MRRLLTLTLAPLAIMVLVAGAGTKGEIKSDQQPVRTVEKLAPTDAKAPEVRVESTESAPSFNTASNAATYNLDWWSINGGGDVAASSASYQMGMSVGQSVAGAASSASYGMGIGFWYGAAAAAACPITATGDVNVNGSITSADIIYLVGYVFKGGAAPLPCAAAGDVNCNGSVTSADIIYLVGYVFKGGPAPCDVCTLVPGTWACP